MAISDEIAKRFPSFAQLAKIPEIQQLLIKAADPANDWTSEFFAAKLHETTWWKRNSASSRKSIALELGDPGEFGNQLAQYLRQIRTIQAEQGIQLSWARAGQLANKALDEGWDEAALNYAVVSWAGMDAQKGGLNTAVGKIKESAAEYGVNVSDGWAFMHAKNAAMNGVGLDAPEALIKDMAKTQYRHLAKQIDEGFTTKQIAEPYMQTAAELLEKPATAISLNNPLFKKALMQPEKDGTMRVMTAEEWQKTLMTDQRYGWDKTMNAKQSAFALRDQLAETFGAR